MATDIAALTAEIMGKVRDSREVREGVRDVADKAADYARSIAPVYDGIEDKDRSPGTFRDSIEVIDLPDVKGMPAARIQSEDKAAQFIEYGTSKTIEHGTFAQTQQQFDESGTTMVGTSGYHGEKTVTGGK